MERSLSMDMINPCCICQEEIVGEASLDECSHSFCYRCIRGWAEVKYPQLSFIPCPLCKSKSTCIFYNFDSHIGCFDKQCFGNNIQNSFVLTAEHMFRLKCYKSPSLTDSKSFGVEAFWRLKKFLRPNTQLLQPWLTRELYALLLIKDPDVFVHLIIGTIEHFYKTFNERQQKDASALASVSDTFNAAISTTASPFLAQRTER